MLKYERDRLSPSRSIDKTTSKISPYKVSEKSSFSFISGILRKLLSTFDTLVETKFLALSFHLFAFLKKLLSKSLKIRFNLTLQFVCQCVLWSEVHL